MFRIPAAILLLIAFTASTFYKDSVVWDYYTNTASFAKNCVNKDLPAMQCHGKCQMMKKWMERQKKENQNPDQKPENKVEIVSFQSFFASLHMVRFFISSPFETPLSVGHPIDRNRAIFHPPALV